MTPLRRWVGYGLFATLLSCRRDRGREIGPAPERAPAPTPTASASHEPPRVDYLVGWAGDDVRVDAEIGAPRQQHMSKTIPGKTTLTVTLLPLDAKKTTTGAEVIAYVPAVPPCPRVHLIGHAIVVAGTMKSGKGEYAEVSLDVASWRCL
ncbi:MAG: hypothetical protein NVS3B10_18540 [Polyangiales bacterium]